MARNEYSFDGVNAGVASLDGTPTIDHHVRGKYLAAALGAPISRAGVVEGFRNEMAVTVDANRVVTVATGACFVQGADEIYYHFSNDAAKTITLLAADSATARVDAIVLTLNAASVEMVLAKVDGTPGSGQPATPANSQVLAYITVPAQGSGDPTAAYPATRFFQIRQQAASAQTPGGGGGTTSANGRRTIQRPTRANVAAMFNDRAFSRDATKMWALDGSNNLVEYELGDYGFVRNDVANRTFGGGSAGKPLIPYWDAAGERLYAIKGDRAHVLESETASEITTGSGSITLTEIETGAPVTFAAFGNGGAIGVQSGGKVFLVGNSGTGNAVAIAEVSLSAFTATGGTVQMLPAASGIVQHSANAASPITFAAPGDAGSILAGFITAADLSFHTQAQNGRIEQWSAAGTKDATDAEMPSGTVFGEFFDMAISLEAAAVTPAGSYFPGRLPNSFALELNYGNADTAGERITLLGRAIAASPAADADWLASYNDNDNRVVQMTFTSYSTNQAQNLGTRLYHRTGGNWVELANDVVVDPFEALTAEREAAAGRGVRGIYTLTRIDGALCFASAELIIPVVNPAGQTAFWPYLP